jgi:lycopene cyclase domain-containing protein
VWDSVAIWRGHWVFPGPGLVGIKIGLMPLEEYLFALVIPYFILTTYSVLKKVT